MKPVTLVGVALIVLGVLALAYQGITYTTREKVIDLGPLGASALAVALGVGTARTVAASYVDPVILVFVGSFVIAAGLQESGLDRRFAWGLLRRRWATRTPSRLLATMGVITCGLSLWLSNTATTALMLPVGHAVGPSDLPRRDRDCFQHRAT